MVILSLHLPRCASLDFDGPEPTLRLTLLFAISAGHLPLWKALRLSITWYDANESVFPGFTSTCESQTPASLTELDLRDLLFAWTSPAYFDLVVLKLGPIEPASYPTLAQFYSILQGCPRLETLVLTQMSIELLPSRHELEDPFPSSILAPVEFTKLRVLGMRYVPGPTLCHIFSLISAPALDRISFALWNDAVFHPLYQKTAIDSLIPFLPRSAAKSSPTRFRLDMVDFDERER
jgi:hypothetical protein